jgi:hypothetical protein
LPRKKKKNEATDQFSLIIGVNELGNFSQRSDSDDTNLDAFRVIEKMAKDLKELM